MPTIIKYKTTGYIRYEQRKQRKGEPMPYTVYYRFHINDMNKYIDSDGEGMVKLEETEYFELENLNYAKIEYFTLNDIDKMLKENNAFNFAYIIYDHHRLLTSPVLEKYIVKETPNSLVLKSLKLH